MRNRMGFYQVDIKRKRGRVVREMKMRQGGDDDKKKKNKKTYI